MNLARGEGCPDPLCLKTKVVIKKEVLLLQSHSYSFVPLMSKGWSHTAHLMTSRACFMSFDSPSLLLLLFLQFYHLSPFLFVTMLGSSFPCQLPYSHPSQLNTLAYSLSGGERVGTWFHPTCLLTSMPRAGIPESLSVGQTGVHWG